MHAGPGFEARGAPVLGGGGGELGLPLGPQWAQGKSLVGVQGPKALEAPGF